MPEQGTIYQAMLDAAAAPRAVARRTDPDTSWEAAASLGDLGILQRHVLELMMEVGPSTHEALVDAYEFRYGVRRPSTIRTRVRELQRLGFVRVAHRDGRTAGGRRCWVWQGSWEPRWPQVAQPPTNRGRKASQAPRDALRGDEAAHAPLVAHLRALLASGGPPSAILAAITARLEREA